jgi:hypothetical protein
MGHFKGVVGSLLAFAISAAATSAVAQSLDERLQALEKALAGVRIGGFLEGSYSWSDADAGDTIVGRSFDRKDNEFMLNAFQLKLEKPVDTEHWDAGFVAKLFFGQNATLIQSAGLNLGDHGDLQEGYVWLNAPIGNGVQIKAGKWVTLMGVEVIEDILNPTWSEGNQFLFVENFTGTGVEVSYRWNDLLDTQVRVYNGWDVVDDNNNAKSFMGRIGFTFEKATLAVIPYGGPEQPDNSKAWRKGVNVVATLLPSENLTLFGQADYGHEDANAALPDPTSDAQWWALGFWALAQLDPHWGIGFRADYVDDMDGARTSGAPFTAPFPPNTGNRFWSLTATLNCKLWENVLIRPEVRYDKSSVDDAFGDDDRQVTLGVSVAYVL